MKDGMAMREGATFDILSGDTDMLSGHKEGAIGEKLTQSPVRHAVLH